MKNKISMTKMPISMTFNSIFPDLQDFQAWNQPFCLHRQSAYACSDSAPDHNLLRG
jgi:hypothetical protein